MHDSEPSRCLIGFWEIWWLWSRRRMTHRFKRSLNHTVGDLIRPERKHRRSLNVADEKRRKKPSAPKSNVAFRIDLWVGCHAAGRGWEESDAPSMALHLSSDGNRMNSRSSEQKYLIWISLTGTNSRSTSSRFARGVCDPRGLISDRWWKFLFALIRKKQNQQWQFNFPRSATAPSAAGARKPAHICR